jgi:hypothetical protein
MKDPDRTIESLLAGLRDAEPPAGMHHRVLHAIAGRRVVAYRPRRLMHSAVAITLVCTVAIAIWVPHDRHIPTGVRPSMTNVDTPPTKSPRTVADTVTRQPRRSKGKVLLRPTQISGFPAPPLPLTEQEKLLLRLAHRNDPQDMNLLNPDAQAQESAKATQQFQQFFGMDNDQMRSESE